MSLSIGIVGLPNVGKSTLFNALTKKKVEASNYPFCTIDPNVGVVLVPDERLDKLAKMSQSKKVISTVIEFVDIAGLVKGAHKGEGLGNQFLSHIRECDAICEVIRDFKNSNIVHVAGKIDPEGDKETIGLELVMADLSTVIKSLERTTKDAKSGDKEILKLKTILEKLKVTLDAGKAARDIELTEEEKKIIKNLNLITLKPLIYLLNVNGDDINKDGEDWKEKVIRLNAKQEEEIAGLDLSERDEYIRELGLRQSGLDELIRAAYRKLGLITFLTTGPDETRAWTVKEGTKAPQAAGVIHSDFEEGFIRVEVVNWKVLLEAGSEKAAREKGLIRTEGKDYVIKDGDVCHFLFNK